MSGTVMEVVAPIASPKGRRRLDLIEPALTELLMMDGVER
jgi:hypothetical protein